MQKDGYPSYVQNLIYGGRALQDCRSLQDYYIQTTSTIVLNLRLPGAGSVKKPSNVGKGCGSYTSNYSKVNKNQINEDPIFKNILQGNRTATKKKTTGRFYL